MLSAAPYASTDTADSTHTHTHQLPSAILCAAQSRQHKRHFCTHIAQFYLHIAGYGHAVHMLRVCVCPCIFVVDVRAMYSQSMCPFIDIAFMLRGDVVICCANRCYRNRSNGRILHNVCVRVLWLSAPCARIMNEIQ